MKAKEYYNSTRMVETRNWTLDMAMNFAEEYYEERTKALTIQHVVGQSEQLVCDKNELECPYDFTSRCTMGRCDCKPKAN